MNHQVEGVLRRDVLFGADVADLLNHAARVGEPFQQVVVHGRASGHLRQHQGLAFGAVTQGVPQLFRDERHEWVHDGDKSLENVRNLFECGAIYRLLEAGLHNLQEAGAEVVPNQLVDGHEGLRKLIDLEILFHVGEYLIDALFHPCYGKFGVQRLRNVVVHRPAFHQAEGVPDLVVEVAALFAQCLVEQQVVARRRTEQHAEAHAVGAVFLHQHDGVGRVAQRFGHLAMQLVAHRAGEIDILERNHAAPLQSGHDHTGHPEENDVRGRDQCRGGVVVVDFRVVGLANAVEHRQRPQPGGEPGVHHILVLLQILFAEVQLGIFLFCDVQGLVDVVRHHKFVVRQVERRDAVTPPQLAANTPILHVLHPMGVCVFEFIGVEFDVILHHGLQSGLCHLVHLAEPLHGEFGLNHLVGSLGEAHLVDVILNLDQAASLFQQRDNGLAGLEAVHADQELCGLAQRAVVVEDVDGLQMVLDTEVVVVDVVRGRDFQCTRAELALYVLIVNQWDGAVYERHNGAFALVLGVTLVLRMHTDGRVAQDGLGARGGDGDVLARLAFDGIAHVVELGLQLFVNYLLIGNGGQRFGVPVDHAHATINLAFVVQIHKDVNHGF